MKKIITIDGMSCMHCVKRVETSLKSLDEKAKVKVNLKKNEASFVSKSDISVDQITKAITEVGYEVTSIK